jgi:hypothetical protein
MTLLHVVIVAIGALLDFAGIYVGKANDVTPIATMIVAGAMGHAGSSSMRREHRAGDKPETPGGTP